MHTNEDDHNVPEMYVSDFQIKWAHMGQHGQRKCVKIFIYKIFY